MYGNSERNIDRDKEEYVMRWVKIISHGSSSPWKKTKKKRKRGQILQMAEWAHAQKVIRKSHQKRSRSKKNKKIFHIVKDIVKCCRFRWWSDENRNAVTGIGEREREKKERVRNEMVPTQPRVELPHSLLFLVLFIVLIKVKRLPAATSPRATRTISLMQV